MTQSNYTLMVGTSGNQINVTLLNGDGSTPSAASIAVHGAASVVLVAPDGVTRTVATTNVTVAGNVVTLSTLPTTITQAGTYKGQVVFADGALSSIFTITATASL